MSTKQFETFLTEHFLKESADSIQAGYRYQFQSPDSENSKKLHQAFIELSQSKVNVKSIAINVLTCGQVNLIPVLHNENGEGFSENFISHLRDEVAGQQGQLKGTALLVIHNSMLDTLINSAEDVAQPGCVWHAEVIKESMKSLINYDDDSHQVSECLLEHRFKQILDDGATMFGFVELYKALLDGDLQFGELGLLEDPAILNWSGKQEQINERLDKNKKLYEKLDFITHHFPNELDEKLAEINFSEKFISKNFGGDKPERWRTELELGACFQEQAKNLNNSLELETETLKQGELISRNKSESKMGMRDRQLILILEPEQTEFNLELNFLGGSVDKKQCVIQHNKLDDISVTTRDGDKRSKVKVSGQFNQQPLYFSLILKREKTAERFKFRVLVLPANEFYIDSFRHCYLIEPNKNRITLQTEDNSFCIAEQGNKAKLEEVGDVFETARVSEIDFEQVANESDRLHFIVKSNNSNLTFNVEGAIATDSLTLPLLLDQDRFVRLYQNDYFGTFKRAEGKLSKIILDNKEVAPKGRRLTLLQWETELVDNQLLTRKDDETACVYLQHIEGDYPELYLAYRNIFNFCTEHKTLPSILGWGSNFRALVSDVVTSYLKAIEEIGIDIMLSKAQKRLVNIGFANYNDEELLTPFHPLNLAYYLNLANNIVADEEGSFKGLPKVTISRLNAQGLLPFVYHHVHGFSYNQLEKDNCFWLKLVPQQDTSYAYVRKLVKEKVGEFKDAFSALFNAGARSTLIINSVNNQKNHELFLGLVDYVKNQKDKICQIHVNLYDDKLSFTEFDKFAETASYDEIKALYELDKGAIREQADTIIDLLRTRLTYSKFENRKTTEQAYAHLSFFRNNNKVEPTDVNVAEELSGVVCNGLLAGEAAASKQDSYFTSFGLKGVDTKSLPHLRVAKSLASLIKPSRKSNEQHSLSKSMALAVSGSFKTLLDRSYQSSIWTTIIDPKVTLDFFENATDLVLIHYSDNYTNSVNYDAITVSKQTELYKKVLEQDEGGITEEFNAFNGEWLLKMIKADGDARKNENDRKEKKGIIGAYKFVNCLLAKSDITWVPLSVAEMIRVAGNIGLKMTDSDFSRHVQGYKSGLISDDVLFVGFKDQQMYLLPLEVKTGIKQTHNKGIQQAKELKRYLTEDILGRQDFAGGLYRGLFIRQILMQVDKYKLYNLYQDDYFTDFTNQREWWLQGDYSLAEINNYPEGFLVSHVENDTFFEAEFTEVENILKIQLPISYLRGFVSTRLQELMHEVCPEKLCYIPEKYLLGQTNSSPLVPRGKVEGCNKAELNSFHSVRNSLNEIVLEENDATVYVTPIQKTEPIDVIYQNTLIKDIVVPELCQIILERVQRFTKTELTVNIVINSPSKNFVWLSGVKNENIVAFDKFKLYLKTAAISVSNKGINKSEVIVKEGKPDQGPFDLKTQSNAKFNLSKKQITRSTLINDLEVPDDCKSLIERVENFSKTPLNVQMLLSVEEYKFEWQHGVSPLAIKSFKVFKDLLIKAIDSFSDSKILFKNSDLESKKIKTVSIEQKAFPSINLAVALHRKITEIPGADEFKRIITRLKQAKGKVLSVGEFLKIDESWLIQLRGVKPSHYDEFKKLKQYIYDSLDENKIKDISNPEDKMMPLNNSLKVISIENDELSQQQVRTEAIEKLKPSDVCIGDWEDILSFTNKENPHDAEAQLTAIKFQLSKFYAVLDTQLDGYYKEVIKIKENADWLYPGDYESQLQFLHDEINKINNSNITPVTTVIETVSTKSSKIDALKPASIDDSDWEEILLFAKELKQRKQIAIDETVKKQVSFYNEIKELRLKEPHEQLNQFESIIAEAEITYPSDYEKQYRFIKVQLDNRVTESPVLSIPTDIPKDIAENIVKAANEAYFDDKEMFDIFIKEQTEAFLAIATLKPAAMPDWSWDTLVSHTEQIYIDDYSGQLTEFKKHISAYNDIENMNLPGARQKLHETKQEARELHPGDYCNQLKVILNEWKNLEVIHEKMKGQLQAKSELLDLNIDGINSSDIVAIKRVAEDICPDDFIGQKLAVNEQAVYYLKVHEIVFDEHPELLQEVKYDADKLTPGDYQSQFDYINEQLEQFKLEQSKEQTTPVIKPTDTLKVLIGHNVQNEQPILWEPTNTAKFMNTNSGIIGTMGTGKTQCTKSVVTQLYRNQHNNVDGKPIGILIFDYKSDYVDDKFIEATQGKKFNLHKLPYNPLSLFGDTPMLPVHTARGFSETMGRAFGLGQKQTLKLRKLIGEAYDLAGIKKGDPSTWLKPAPTIADVWALFEESEPKEDSLYAALESLHELEIFETDITKCTSLYELVDGITVIELAGYPGEIQNLVVALTLDLFYSQMQKQGKPEVQGDFRQVTKLLLVDEADNFMSQNFPSLRKVLKEGREYGVGVILSTQDITHFKTSENDYSAYILSWVIHRVGQIKNQDIKSIFNKDDKADQEQLMKSIRELDKHYSLYVDGDKKVQKIKDKAFWELLNEYR